MSDNISFLDEIGCLKDFDMSVPCASIAESHDTSDCNSLNGDCVDHTCLVDVLLDSQNLLSKKLCAVNLDNERIMDELVRVNSEIDLLILDNEVKRKEIRMVEQAIKHQHGTSPSINVYASPNIDQFVPLRKHVDVGHVFPPQE